MQLMGIFTCFVVFGVVVVVLVQLGSSSSPNEWGARLCYVVMLLDPNTLCFRTLAVNIVSDCFVMLLDFNTFTAVLAARSLEKLPNRSAKFEIIKDFRPS